MTEGTVFPRGRGDVAPVKDLAKKVKADQKNKKKRNADLLFGKAPDVKPAMAAAKRSRRQQADDAPKRPQAVHSLLPLGGGGVNLKRKLIEPLSFGTLCPGFKLLAAVKEVHEALAIFSLPNMWTGYMLADTVANQNVDCQDMLRVGQVLAVSIVKAVVDGSRRRIQVTVAPQAVNPKHLVAGLTVRARVVSVEDHGLLVDLGNQRRGFLELEDPSAYEANAVLDCVVGEKPSNAIVPLALLPANNQAYKLPKGHKPTLPDLFPGTRIQVTVEETLRNGLAVTFGAFRGCIEVAHAGGQWDGPDSWKQYFATHPVLQARILAVEPRTKTIRLTALPHLMGDSEPCLPVIGTLVTSCRVIRMDHGVGALLALPEDEQADKPMEDNKLLLSLDKTYAAAARTKAIYVHISKALDTTDAEDGKVPEHVFGKQFALGTRHDVRVLSTANLIEGVASGATAPSILRAHVLTHADIQPGCIFKQVPVCSQLEGGSVLVEFGQGIRGLIPQAHLFDQVVQNEFRNKIRKVKYSVGAKVNVRVLSVNPQTKKCLVTAKKVLVDAEDDKIIVSYEGAKVGQIAVGYVSKVDSEGLFVTFFNNTFGRVTARSLAMELGMENHRANYSIGDGVECRVVSCKKRIRREKLSCFREDGDEMKIDEEEDGRRFYYELSLSMKLVVPRQIEMEATGSNQTEIRLKAGCVLPCKSLQVVELVKGKEKRAGFVPGYAIVSIKSQHIVGEAEASSLTTHVECKLPYDQLLDRYRDSEVETAQSLDQFAEGMLVVGKKINRQGIILSDPKKSNAEYINGTGQLVVVSIRKKLVETALQSVDTELDEEHATIPSPSSHFFVGARLQGYVVQVRSRHGAFVRFLDGMTGLVPKLKGGLALKLYSTVTVKVVAVDDKVCPPRILLGLTHVNEKARSKAVVSQPAKEVGPPPLAKGDIVQNAVVAHVGFRRADLRILDEKIAGCGNFKAYLHCSMIEYATNPKDATSGNESSEPTISSCHPFHNWKNGKKLTELRVVSVEETKGMWIIELTTRREMSFPLHSNDLSPGDKISGFVMKVADDNDGLWLQVGPNFSAFVPALELSSDINVLNDMTKYFPYGSQLCCEVIDRKAWYKTRSKFHKTHWNPPKSFVYASLLASEEDRGKPSRGTLVVGRIDRFMPSVAAPALTLDLRDGYIGRCCITELAERDDWANFPLGHERNREDRDSEIEDEKGESAKEEPAQDAVASNVESKFPHGAFVTCRVLTGIPSKPVVEVSLRSSRIDGDLDSDEPPEAGDIVHGYVVATSKKGCFLRLARQIVGRAMLRELSDGYLQNSQASFPPGRLVVGKIKAIRPCKKRGRSATTEADVDMRESVVMLDSESHVAFADVNVGEKYGGTVSSIEDYGVFVRIENSNVSGLVHKSECSDKYVKHLADLFDPGDLVKLLVIKKDNDKKQIGFSMKASHFQNEEESDDSTTGTMDVEGSNFAEPVENDMSSSDENVVSILASSNHGDETGTDSTSTDTSESSDDSDHSDEEKVMDTNVGFDWSVKSLAKAQSCDNSDSDSVDSNDETENVTGSSHKSRKKQAAKRLEEQAISKRERAMADGTADENPETAADFERLLAGDPNSSEVWIKYMAFHLTLADISAARTVANRAFERIEFRRERDKINVWCALLTLEWKYGGDDMFHLTLDRACQQNNPKQVYLRVCEMLEKQSSTSSPEAVRKMDEMYAKACKKFKDKKKVWIAQMAYLLRNSRYDEAHAISKRALLSLKPHKHVETVSKFAQLVFEFGSAGKARSIFEGLILKYPKRLDIFFVFADKEIKFGDIDKARALFRRVVSPTDESLKLKLSDKQMKHFFKKWFSFEETFGTPASQEIVKDEARAFVKRAASF